MHIFLTGPIQVGKTTLIRRTLQSMQSLRLGGFRTITAADVPGATGSLYIVEAAEGRCDLSADNRVGIRRGPGLGAIAFPNAFDQWGTALLADAEQADLILMDEIGKMEQTAFLFCGRVRELLDGVTPILGVVRQEGQTPLQCQIRSHPNVRLIEVTTQNRDALTEELPKLLRWELNKQVDSAGAFVFRDGADEKEVLMIRGRRGWAFPKGHIQPGETAEGAAIREVLEETGIQIQLLPGFRYEVASGLPDEHRVITYFLGTASGDLLCPQPEEVLEAAWVPVTQAKRQIRFPQDVPAFEAAWAADKRSY